jgi:hypothetical protein
MWQEYKTTLEQAGIVFAAGLTKAELSNIEETYGFHFPPDLAEFLSLGLPVSDHFVDWRSHSPERIRRRLSWPYEGICFDIEHDNFWLEKWGERPTTLAAAFERAKQAVDQAPKLIPIFSHRYIPDRPLEAENPVFSVYQTDIIYYGTNLSDYFENEFQDVFGRTGHDLRGTIKEIEFWSQFAIY